MHKAYIQSPNLYVLLGLYIIFMSFHNIIYAQTCSCASTPITSAMGLGSISSSNWQIQLQYDQHTMSYLVSESEVLERNTNYRASQSALLKVTRTFTNRVQGSLIIPWVSQTFRNRSTLSAKGIGDIMLLAQYRILGKQGGLNRFYIEAGIKLPTGATNINYNNILLSPDLQPGTGAWDGIISAFYVKNGLWSPSSQLHWLTSYRITSTAQRFQNRQSYQFGPEVLSQLSISQNINTLNLSLIVRYRQTASDKINNQTAFNTGGQWINLGNGIQWQWLPSMSLQGNIFFPIYRNVEGVQLTSSWRINIGLVFQLGNGSKKAIDIPSLDNI